jgi:hypothetical protein
MCIRYRATVAQEGGEVVAEARAVIAYVKA